MPDQPAAMTGAAARRDQRRQRGIARERRRRRARRPRRRAPPARTADQHAEIGRDALAALEAEPDRKIWPRKAPSPAIMPRSAPNCSPATSAAGRALQRVEQQGGGRQPLVAGAQHVGRADIARADLAHVAQPGHARQQQAERDRAEQIAEDQRDRRQRVSPCPRPASASRDVGCEYCAARNQVCKTLPCSRAPSKRRVLRARDDAALADDPRRMSRSTMTMSAGAPAQACRPAGRRFPPALSTGTRRAATAAQIAIVVEPQRGGEQRLQPDRAIGGVGKRQPLGVDILRIMRRRR